MSLPALLASIKETRTWREVGEYLGGGYSGAFWRLIASGERHATTEQENIVRLACGLPALEPPPAEALTGIDRIVRCSKRPNTAIMAAVSGEVTLVRLRVSKTGEDVPATIPVTLSYSHGAQRKQHQGRSVFCMSDLANLPPSAFATIRGKTGNLSAIASAAARAAEVWAV